MRYVILFLILGLTQVAHAQLGIKGGFYTVQAKGDPLVIYNPNTFRNFELSLKEARYGFHIGALYKINIEKFFIQPEVVLNSNSSTYTFEDFGISQVLEENYQFIDIPLMLGFDLGVLNLFAGPVGHVFIGSTSELSTLDGFKQKWNEVSWGWQAGIGFDIWRLNIDLRYEGNFYQYGDHIEFFGESYDFSNRPQRIITSLAFMFGS